MAIINGGEKIGGGDMERSSERRKHKRVALSISARVTGPQDAQRLMLERASTVNISQGGAYLRTGDRPEVSPGERVNIHMSMLEWMTRRKSLPISFARFCR